MSKTLASIGMFVLGAALLVASVGVAATGNVALAGALAKAGAALEFAAVARLTSSIFEPGARRPDTTETSRKSPLPTRTRAYGQLRLYGDWILFGHKADNTPVDVWAFHDGQAAAILQVYLNDDKVTISGGVVQPLADRRYRDNRVLAGYNLGLPTETAHSAVVAALPGIWTSDHRGDGVVTGYLIKQLTKTDKFLETYPNGDDIQMSLAGQWSRVFDFRDEAQDAYDPATWEYRDNSALALLHYLITQRGVDFTTQILPQIDLWTAAADDCDSAVPLAGGGTEPRYRIALAYEATEQPAAVVKAILNTFDGWYCENERGEILVHSGRFYEPTVSLGPSQIVDYSVQEHVAAEDAVNEVLITYVSAEHDYGTVDAQAWRDEAAIAASGREPVSVGLEAQIPSPSQGRRLAKRKMLRSNAPKRGTVLTTFSGRSVLGERFVNLLLQEAGVTFYDGPVEIVGSPERDMQTGGLRFEWIAVDPAVDDWDPDEETGEAPPVGGLPDLTPKLPSAVLNLSVSGDASGLLIAGDWDACDNTRDYLVEVFEVTP